MRSHRHPGCSGLQSRAQRHRATARQARPRPPASAQRNVPSPPSSSCFSCAELAASSDPHAANGIAAPASARTVTFGSSSRPEFRAPRLFSCARPHPTLAPANPPIPSNWTIGRQPKPVPREPRRGRSAAMLALATDTRRAGRRIEARARRRRPHPWRQSVERDTVFWCLRSESAPFLTNTYSNVPSSPRSSGTSSSSSCATTRKPGGPRDGLNPWRARSTIQRSSGAPSPSSNRGHRSTSEIPARHERLHRVPAAKTVSRRSSPPTNTAE
jgi:hypothetical protein